MEVYVVLSTEEYDDNYTSTEVVGHFTTREAAVNYVEYKNSTERGDVEYSFELSKALEPIGDVESYLLTTVHFSTDFDDNQGYTFKQRKTTTKKCYGKCEKAFIDYSWGGTLTLVTPLVGNELNVLIEELMESMTRISNCDYMKPRLALEHVKKELGL